MISDAWHIIGGFVRMKTIVRTLLATALLAPAVLSASYAFGGYREQLHLTSVEAAQLPKFCWAQMEVPGATGPEYQINDCGVAANHYCPGILYLIRAKSYAYRSSRGSLLEHADIDIAYTERSIKDSPSCSIRGHVAASRAEVNNLLSIYGNKRPKSPPALP
jgi:hypothetical protein